MFKGLSIRQITQILLEDESLTLPQGNLLKTALLNEKQNNLEKEMYGNISLDSEYFSSRKEVISTKHFYWTLILCKTNEKVFYFIFLDKKSSL